MECMSVFVHFLCSSFVRSFRYVRLFVQIIFPQAGVSPLA